MLLEGLEGINTLLYYLEDAPLVWPRCSFPNNQRFIFKYPPLLYYGSPRLWKDYISGKVYRHVQDRSTLSRGVSIIPQLGKGQRYSHYQR